MRAQIDCYVETDKGHCGDECGWRKMTCDGQNYTYAYCRFFDAKLKPDLTYKSRYFRCAQCKDEV